MLESYKYFSQNVFNGTGNLHKNKSSEWDPMYLEHCEQHTGDLSPSQTDRPNEYPPLTLTES